MSFDGLFGWCYQGLFIHLEFFGVLPLILTYFHRLLTQPASYTRLQPVLFDNPFFFCYYDYFRTKRSGG